MKLRNKKTGKVFDVIVREKSNGDGEYSIIVCNLRALRSARSVSSILGEYDSLAEFNENWEDYKPADPQIEDELARKTVKSWYSRNNIIGKLCSYGGSLWLGLRGSDEDGVDWKIELNVGHNSQLKDDKLYSLTELIGEEE